jgi:glycerol-3-phosphate acyltransferase PlsY
MQHVLIRFNLPVFSIIIWHSIQIMDRSILLIIASILLSYLLGSIPTAYLAGRLVKKTDIREMGSKNMGAMNTFYSIGIVAGLIVLAVDIIKGTLAVFLTEKILSLANQPPDLWMYVSGVVVVLGHSFPVWLKFRGGKGGATCIGVLARMVPWGSPFYLGLFLLLLAATRFPTLSYSIAFVVFPLVAWLWYHNTVLAIYSILILLIPGIRYIPRILEMRSKGGGSWKRVFKRSSLKDRL